MATESSTFSKAFAVWRPAVFSEQGPTPCKEDETCVMRRTHMSAYAAVVACGVTLALTTNPVFCGLALTATALTPFATIFYESYRALRNIEQRAFAAMNQGKPPQKLFQSLIQEPRALERLLEKHPHFDFSNCKSDQGHNLLDTLLHKDGTEFSYCNRGWNLINALIDKYGLSSDDFLFIMNHSPQLAAHLIKNNKIGDLLALSPEKQFACWLNTTSYELAQLMVDKGLDINQRNAQGLTAIEQHLSDIATGHYTTPIPWRILNLLRANALPPAPDRVLAGKPLDKILASHPEITQMFLQARGDNRPLKCSKPSKWFSFEPAVIISDVEFRVKRSQIIARMALAVLGTTLALAAVGLYAPLTAAGAAAILLPLVAVKVYTREFSKAEAILKEVALEELGRPFPRNAAYAYCVTRPDILNTLTVKHLNQLSDNNTTLWSHLAVKKEFYKNLKLILDRLQAGMSKAQWIDLIVDKLVPLLSDNNLKLVLDRLQAGLSKAQWIDLIVDKLVTILSDNMLKDVLKELKAADFTPAQQHSLFMRWPLVQSLVELGFDINARDHEGFTPLLRAVKDERLILTKRLLSHGADCKATLQCNNSAFTAESFAQGNGPLQERLRTILKEHSQE